MDKVPASKFSIQLVELAKIESNRIKLMSSICLVFCKANASIACLLVTKPMLISLYYQFKQFAIILILIFLNSRVNSN